MLYPTNGLMPDLIRERIEEILAHCPRSVIVTKLSIDGIYEKHDRLRNTPHSFEKTIKTYNLLSPLLEKYPNFEIRYLANETSVVMTIHDGKLAFFPVAHPNESSKTTGFCTGNLYLLNILREYFELKWQEAKALNST